MDYWQTKRPFGWGIVLFLDRDAVDVPELSDSPVSQSRHGFVVRCLMRRMSTSTGSVTMTRFLRQRSKSRSRRAMKLPDPAHSAVSSKSPPVFSL